MLSSKKKTIKDWEEDLYPIYLQNEYDIIMPYNISVNYCKGYKHIEDILGYTWKDVERSEE